MGYCSKVVTLHTFDCDNGRCQSKASLEKFPQEGWTMIGYDKQGLAIWWCPMCVRVQKDLIRNTQRQIKSWEDKLKLALVVWDKRDNME